MYVKIECTDEADSIALKQRIVKFPETDIGYYNYVKEQLKKYLKVENGDLWVYYNRNNRFNCDWFFYWYMRMLLVAMSNVNVNMMKMEI